MYVSYKSQTSGSKYVILPFFANSSVLWWFWQVFLYFDKSQAPSGSPNPFYASRASIWAQAQLSSSISLEDMSKTMAPIASKLQKKKTTILMVTSNQHFFKCHGWTISQWLGFVLQRHWGMRIIDKHSVLSFLPEVKDGGWITRIWL